MKSGFVSIIGRPNVGKSTLLNSFIGEKISIISDKPQTTRNNIIGVYTQGETQIIFTDTPGIHKPKTMLGDFMVKSAYESLNDVDAILFVVEPKIAHSDEKIIERFKNSGIPVILIINKIDTVAKDNLLPVIQAYSSIYDFKSIIPVSAIKSDGIEIILKEVDVYLSEGPMFYPEEMITDQTERQLVAEIIREKLLRTLNEEVPHGIAIEIFKMEEKEKITNIQANIYCEKKSHKGIIIGKNGESLKRVGTYARDEIEKMLGKKVFLELWVKVKEDWRNSRFYNRSFGYEKQQ